MSEIIPCDFYRGGWLDCEFFPALGAPPALGSWHNLVGSGWVFLYTICESQPAYFQYFSQQYIKCA